jgi:hypothetical protein
MEEWNDGMLEYWVIFYKNFQLITIIPVFQYSKNWAVLSTLREGGCYGRVR